VDFFLILCYNYLMETLNKKSIFWDVDPNQLNLTANSEFIISRVLNYGDIADYRWALKFYGPKKIRHSVEAGKQLDNKSTVFWRQYFNLDKKEWSPRQLTAKLAAFWTR
jgi:hypothetical protein